jgi:hypothetical protein
VQRICGPGVINLGGTEFVNNVGRHLGVVCVSPPERISMNIPLDMDNIPKTTNEELLEDRKELIRILLAFVVMAIIFWVMLISLSAPCNNSGQVTIPGNVYLIDS